MSAHISTSTCNVITYLTLCWSGDNFCGVPYTMIIMFMQMFTRAGINAVPTEQQVN